jgi:hypothetical protein
MATKTGKVIHNKGKYFLEMEGKSQLINEKTLSDPAALKSMAGQNVEVTVSSGANAFPVDIALAEAGAKKPKKPRILCYVPPVDMLKNVKMDLIRPKLADQLLKEGHITQEIHRNIKLIK